MDTRGRREGGLTLIEVIVILAVLIILIGLLVPSAVQQLTAARRSETLDEMENLKKAIIGDPSLKSQGVRTDFGYLGDMGNLPASLDDLVTQGTQPSFAFNSTKRVGAGWKGPYITLGPGADASSHKRDAFGNDYTYDTTDFTNSKGQLVDAKLVTLGADGVTGGSGVDEDITLEILKAETTSTVSGNAFDQSGNPLNGASIILNFPQGGVLTTSTATTDSNGFYQFTNVSFGVRSITLEPRLLLVPGSPRAFGAQNSNVEFRVVNYSSSAITVASLTATWSTSPAFLNEVRWDGTQVYRCTGSQFPKASGDLVPFSSDRTVAAGSQPMPPTLVYVDNSSVQVADITIKGSGTEATVQLRDFFDEGGQCRGGNRVSMVGASFTVTLRDPAANIVGQMSFTVP